MKLLDVCELDSRALQLRHRRAHLPQAAVVAELQASKKTTDDAVRDARVIRDDLERVQKKADAEEAAEEVIGSIPTAGPAAAGRSTPTRGSAERAESGKRRGPEERKGEGRSNVVVNV